CRNLLLEPFVCSRVLEISLDVIDSLQKPVPKFLVYRLACELLDVLAELSSKRFGGYGIVREADDGELRGKQLALRQIAQCRNQLPLGEVAAGSEDHHYTGATVLSLFLHGFSHICQFRSFI